MDRLLVKKRCLWNNCWIFSLRVWMLTVKFTNLKKICYTTSLLISRFWMKWESLRGTGRRKVQLGWWRWYQISNQCNIVPFSQVQTNAGIERLFSVTIKMSQQTDIGRTSRELCMVFFAAKWDCPDTNEQSAAPLRLSSSYKERKLLSRITKSNLILCINLFFSPEVIAYILLL